MLLIQIPKQVRLLALRSSSQSSLSGRLTPLSLSRLPAEEIKPLDTTLPMDEIKRMLQIQLEYYFSRDNLSHDTYLLSQMDR